MDNSIKDNIDYKILIRIVCITLVILAAYIIFDLIIGIKKESYTIQAFITIIWLIMLFFVMKGKHIVMVKHISISAMMISIYAGFFVMNGIHGVTTLDFFNLLLLISILFEGRTRMFYWVMHFFIAACLIYINFTLPDLIINIYKRYDDVHMVFGSGIRMLNLLILVSLIRDQFSRETTQINQMNLKLKEQNHELVSLNEEIREQSNELAVKNKYINSINTDLEKEVKKRTQRVIEQNKKLIEYAYFNSHKVRGPLARILGLSHLIQANKEIKKEDLFLYVNLMDQNANELDSVIKNINNLLSEDQIINDSLGQQ